MREAAHELPDDIFLQTTDTDPYYQRKGVAKLRDKYSNYAGWAAKSPGLKYHNGLQVEFCIRDTVYSRTVAKWFNYLTFGIKKGLNFSQYISYWRFYALSRESIFPLTYLEFEGSMFPCLNDYEDYLRFHYGDHTKLPPIEHQVPQNGCGEPFIPCNHKEILFWNEQSRIEWVKAWDIEQNDWRHVMFKKQNCLQEDLFMILHIAYCIFRIAYSVLHIAYSVWRIAYCVWRIAYGDSSSVIGYLYGASSYSNPKSFVFNHQKTPILGRMPFILLAQGFSPG